MESKNKILIIPLLFLLVIPFSLAWWFDYDIPPQILNNNTNLTVNTITSNQYCDEYGCYNLSDTNITNYLNLTVINYVNATANASDYWDNLDTPADINTSELNNDAGFITGVWDIVENWIYNNSGSLDFNEIKLNETIDHKISLQDHLWENVSGTATYTNNYNVSVENEIMTFTENGILYVRKFVT